MRQLGPRKLEKLNIELLQRLRDGSLREASQRLARPSANRQCLELCELDEQSRPLRRVETAAEAQLSEAVAEQQRSQQSVGGDKPYSLLIRILSLLLTVQIQHSEKWQPRQKLDLRCGLSIGKIELCEGLQPEEQFSSALVSSHVSDVLPSRSDGRPANARARRSSFQRWRNAADVRETNESARPARRGRYPSSVSLRSESDKPRGSSDLLSPQPSKQTNSDRGATATEAQSTPSACR